MRFHRVAKVEERFARDVVIVRKSLLEQRFAEGMVEPRCGENEDGSQSAVNSCCDATEFVSRDGRIEETIVLFDDGVEPRPIGVLLVLLEMIEQCEHFDEDMFRTELESLGQSADVEARVLDGDEERVRGVVISDVCEIGGPEFAQHFRIV